jgi:hypothetical protein
MNSVKTKCDLLEEKALLSGKFEEWNIHSADCPSCRQKVELIRRLKRSASSVNAGLDAFAVSHLKDAFSTAAPRRQMRFRMIASAAAIVLTSASVVFLCFSPRAGRAPEQNFRQPSETDIVSLSWDFDFSNKKILSKTRGAFPKSKATFFPENPRLKKIKNIQRQARQLAFNMEEF